VTSIEDRVRAATAAAANLVPEGTAPPLRLSPPSGPKVPRPRRERLRALAAPIAAAAAVVMVVAIVTVTHDYLSRPRPAATVVAPKIPPPYFVALTYVGHYRSWKLTRTDAVIASTATGQAILRIAPPKPYDTFSAVTSAYDGRTFVLEAQDPTPDTRQYPTKTKFFELQVTLRGTRSVAAAVTPLPIPALPASLFGPWDGIALSPDGTELAVTHADVGRTLPDIRVYDVATGRYRSWAMTSSEIAADPAVQTPSWQADGRHLALDVSWRNPGKTECLDCVRLLDTALPSGHLLADSKILVRSPDLHVNVQWNTTAITPDGRHVLRSAIVPVPVTKNSFYDRPWIYDYSASTGRLLRSVVGARAINWSILWTSPDGGSFIYSAVSEGLGSGFITAIRYAGGHRTTLRLPAQTLTAAW
jgi:hypothetical protein